MSTLDKLARKDFKRINHFNKQSINNSKQLFLMGQKKQFNMKKHNTESEKLTSSQNKLSGKIFENWIDNREKVNNAISESNDITTSLITGIRHSTMQIHKLVDKSHVKRSLRNNERLMSQTDARPIYNLTSTAFNNSRRL